MTARATDEAHRVSSPLELLFDLTFVAAISQIAAQLAHAIEDGNALQQLVPYGMVFFAIWWAWMNFTWFASAYDTDDVPYRLLTLLQMGGVLVLAAGVPSAFDGSDFRYVTLGYFIMRIALVAQWVRAAVQHPEGRRTALRYAGGILVVQALWIARLAFPEGPQVALFLLLMVLELSVPPWAERTGKTSWHPHHIAERYGLFTIILLGESVLASTFGVQAVLGSGVTPGLVVIAASGLILLFTLWWIYFSKEAGTGLEQHRDRSFFWGYGHYFVFAALAALGAGFEAAVASTAVVEPGATEALFEAEHHASALALGFGVAIPVAVFLVLLWVLHAPIIDTAVVSPVGIIIAAVLVLLVPLLPLEVPSMLALITVVTAALLTFHLVAQRVGRTVNP